MPNILVVDDDEATAGLFRRVAEREGFQVTTAHSAWEAQLAMERIDPGVVIVDMVMPDVDGIEFVRWLATHGYRGRIVLVSGYAEAYMQAASAMARAAGMADVQVLTKPVSLDRLREAMGEASAA